MLLLGLALFICQQARVGHGRGTLFATFAHAEATHLVMHWRKTSTAGSMSDEMTFKSAQVLLETPGSFVISACEQGAENGGLGLFVCQNTGGMHIVNMCMWPHREMSEQERSLMRAELIAWHVRRKVGRGARLVYRI